MTNFSMPLGNNSLASKRKLYHNVKHIRPLAVSPLTYSERVPNPWGFFMSGDISTAMVER
ncbi:hypothetical protein [Thiothrix unzii]|jgi:hypothetical protein|uniref:Uncharacterized protein n=1 Tax=Thiothrix unzii TaxID=111769 RepID=A0A975IG48_9GAMM|nr:hypothetical protein [Thiothrix unzii]MDX9990242.1 hypothetical protein [Thiothrix unzii]QTR52158.1 hypothetical protein J9260_10390 [Thiothrix unzii]